MFLLRVLFLIGVCTLGVQGLQAQPSTKQLKPLVLDSKEDFAKAKYNHRPPKRQQIDYIYKRQSKGVLFGNPCATKATRKMGFEYVLQPHGVPGSPGRIEGMVHNFFMNVKLVVTRSPFWKLILNKRMKDCRTNSGDIVG